MRVVLRLSGEADVEGGSLKTVTLTDRDFFIGRDPSCDWPVSDRLQMMSRRHCSLKKQGDAVLLTDLSSNGTSLGSAANRLVQGQPTPLPDTAVIFLGGEHVRIDYECQLSEAPVDTDDDFWGVKEIKRSRSQPENRKLPADDDLNLFADDDPDRDNPLSLALDATPDRRPIDDLLSLDDDPAPARERPEPPRPAPDTMTFATPASSGPEDLFALDDGGGDSDDPFGDMSPRSGASGGGDPLSLDDAPAPRPAAPDPLSLDDTPAPRPAAPDPLSLDDDLPPRQSDPLSLNDAETATRPAPAQPRTTFDAMPRRETGEHPTTVMPPRAPVAPAPVQQAAVQQAPAQPAPRPASGAASSAAGNGEADRMMAALFASLGLRLEDIPADQRQELAGEIGRCFRTLADGMRELLASRRDVKIALGLGATQIETGSNPLKFARDANDAVNALLKPTASGFLTGSTAVEDATQALQQHQVALVGGVKASMKTALAAFDPDQVEKKLTKKGISQIIPMKRKAELWEQFVENYKEFAAEADEDVRRVIGKQLEQLYADEATRSRAKLNL